MRKLPGRLIQWCPQVNKTGRSGPIYPQHSHSFKVLSSTSHTQFQSSVPRFKRHSDSRMETTHGALNLLPLWGHGCGENFSLANSSLMRGKSQKSYGAKLWLYGGWAITWMFCSFGKVTVTLALRALLSFGIPFPPPGTIDDITFLIRSSNHMVHEVNTLLCVVRG